MSENRMRAAGRMLLACGLCALCAAAHANTTAPLPTPVPLLAQGEPQGERFRRAEPDVVRMRQSRELIPVPEAIPDVVGAQAADDNARGRLRMALLLPLRSPTLKPAAEMVRDGFRAAQERDGGNVDLTVIETDDFTPSILAAYRNAAPRYDIVIGPLSRSAVTALANSGEVNRPTIALAQPESTGDVDLRLPPQLLVMGLSIEDEARQVADWAARDHGGRKALIVSTGVAWQKRAARAFITRWQRDGTAVDVLELSTAGTFLDGPALAQLKKRLMADPPALVFVALDASQTRQLRGVIDAGIALYGTSQLNPLSLPELAGAEPHPELDGVHLLDMPWQLQADHPAVMIYPHPLTIGVQRRGPDMERLYALGIDAFRVASEIGAGQRDFAIDGVTGRLVIRFDGSDPALFGRIEQQAVYSGGVVQAVVGER
jgi:outer membrane PBP1 activator LpoA protein